MTVTEKILQHRLHYLLGELSSRYTIPRKKAIEALAAIGAAAVPGIIEKLDHQNFDTQLAAADALERIGTLEARAAVDEWRHRWNAGV